MPDQSRTDTDTARRIITLSTDRVPEFLNQSPADRTLSRTIVELNKRLLQGPRRERETAEEALIRLGFVTPDPGAE